MDGSDVSLGVRACSSGVDVDDVSAIEGVLLLSFPLDAIVAGEVCTAAAAATCAALSLASLALRFDTNRLPEREKSLDVEDDDDAAFVGLEEEDEGVVVGAGKEPFLCIASSSDPKTSVSAPPPKLYWTFPILRGCCYPLLLQQYRTLRWGAPRLPSGIQGFGTRKFQTGVSDFF